LGVVSELMAFEVMRLDLIIKGVNMDRKEKWHNA
jgi:hypothetical protein